MKKLLLVILMIFSINNLLGYTRISCIKNNPYEDEMLEKITKSILLYTAVFNTSAIINEEIKNNLNNNTNLIEQSWYKKFIKKHQNKLLFVLNLAIGSLPVMHTIINGRKFGYLISKLLNTQSECTYEEILELPDKERLAYEYNVGEFYSI
jgi:hypothetical protein